MQSPRRVAMRDNCGSLLYVGLCIVSGPQGPNWPSRGGESAARVERNTSKRKLQQDCVTYRGKSDMEVR